MKTARPGLIDRQGLLDWAKLRVAESELPRLIRRLILETGRGVAYLGFPAGEGVAASSWDGTVRATEEALYIPQGLSLWEVSVNSSPGAKADKDYEKRTTTPDGSPTSDCTYVEVILRPWTQRLDWARDRTAEGRWKKVSALGVDDVETWLESAPITHAWLSELNGLHPYGLVTAQTWWNTWTAATRPAFPSAVVVAGRDEAITKLRQALGEPGQVVTVRGTSRDEVAAFVASVVLAEEASDGGSLLARTAFIDNVETWRRLRSHQTPLVLVALTEQVAAEFVPGSPHVLIVPLTGTAGADIVLPPIDSQVAAEILKGEGLPAQQATEAGQLARLSLLAARRRLANKPELHQPTWAQPPVPKTVRRLMLIERWNEKSSADHTLVEKVIGVPYDALKEESAGLMVDGDPLLARVGTAVGVVSPIDAWFLLSGELRQDDLEAFHDAARTVFTEIDPRLELPRDERWRASVLGKSRSYSDDLRQGLATTLALLGAHGERTIEGAGMTGAQWAAWIVREMLDAANADATCHLWASLGDVLPLLAEAAPSAFLTAVAKGMNGQSPVLQGIFEDARDSGNPFAPESAHVHLLWALERCAWSREHFGRVVDSLARLAEIDPGGRLANRPIASLEAILLPWHPQTTVPADGRLEAIDGLRERHADVAWQLLVSLLPETQGVTMSINGPEFRDWEPATITVTTQEYWSMIEAVCTRLITDAGRDPQRWVTLVDKIDNLLPPARAAMLARLDELSNDPDLAIEQRQALWEALRAKAAQHREFAREAWALPADEVAAIEATAARFAPIIPVEHHRWLFASQTPTLANVARAGNFAAYDAELAKARASAAAEIAAATDWVALQQFARSTSFPWIVGTALAQAHRHEHEGDLLGLVTSADRHDAAFAEGYFSERFRIDGWSWLEQYLNDDARPTDQKARLLLYTHDYPKAWEVADALGEQVATQFWAQFRTYGLGAFPHIDLAAERLLNADRPAAALDLINLYSRREDDMSQSRLELVARGLEALLGREGGDADSGLLDRYDLMEFINALGGSTLPRERVARLEWAYLVAFGYDSQPATLTNALSTDPEFFVEIIRSIFLSEEEAARQREPVSDEGTGAKDDPQRAAIGQRAYRLLSEWKTIPGRRADGTVDDDALTAWVTAARTKLHDSGHLEIGDQRIGHILAHGPADADGARPCLAVRNLLETLQNDEVELGFLVEVRNSRGVTTRGVFDGGDQERALAATYFEQAEKFANRWPRTAALLRSIGESYEQDAQLLDDDAERRRTGRDS